MVSSMHRTIPTIPDEACWSVILAGGEGVRLRPLTRTIAGDERPKQFCAVIGTETLLQQTIRRVGRLVPPERTKVVLTRKHEQYFTDMQVPAVVQPDNRGTAPAILYSLLSIANENPFANVALFPADHHFSDEGAFLGHVAAAVQAVTQQPDLVILLGIVPTGPEADYGWVQPGEPVCGVLDGGLFRVRRFWEKPATGLAEQLIYEGYLWNTFVLVGAIPKLLRLIRSSLPELYSHFEGVQPAIGTSVENPAMRQMYSRLPVADFSREVLAVLPRALTVLPMKGAKWVDIGTPDRALAVMASQQVGA
ncbi:MAG: putative Nucleotidyl transferase [Bryobacterales bacterium]|nr:putative Nucleotidyl transferase [Bryobacterales bacterium]